MKPFVVLLGPALVSGHGSLVVPPPRNAVERGIAPWNGTMPQNWSHHVDTPICPVGAGLDAATGEPQLSLRNGQSCFWLSHGCTIFCGACDGVTGRRNHAGTCGNEATAFATVCNPLQRTLNRGAVCGSSADSYYYNPWRAPGSAPTFDACGMAGGSPKAISNKAVGVRFANTTFASQGDLGSAVLPPAPSGTVWQSGALAEVSWTVRTNHGGGYQYRLCPRDGQPLTEACFQRTPLPFEGRSALRWDGSTGPASRTLYFDGTYVSNGTVPAGSTWAMNPLPRVDATMHPGVKDAFPAVCYDPHAPAEGGDGGLCSGWYGPDNLEIVDHVRVPAGLAAGDYVVQVRSSRPHSRSPRLRARTAMRCIH